MHRHDQDLIMSLADGTLTGAAGDEARREIDACAQCRTELAQQLDALEWLRSAEPIELSEIEAARLRRTLDEELGHVRTPQPVAATERKGLLERVAWGPLVAVAAVLVGVVFVAGNLSLVGGGDDAGADTAALERATTDTTTAAAVPEALVQATDGGALDQSIPAAPEESADDAAAFAATSTTAAADVAGDGAAEGFDLDQDLDTEPLRDVLGRLQESLGDLRIVQEDLTEMQLYNFQLPLEEEVCLDESAEAFPESLRREFVGIIDLPLAGPVQLIVHLGVGDEVLALAAHDGETCELIGLVGPED